MILVIGNCLFLGLLEIVIFCEAAVGKPGKRNILVPGGKEIERDSVSSGERKRKRLNLPHRQGLKGFA